MEELKNLIIGSYGTADHKFAQHEFDKERARESIVEAGKQNISFVDFIKIHKDFLKEVGCTPKQISNEIKRVKDLQSYLD